MHAFGHSFKTHGTIAEITIYGERAIGHVETIEAIRKKLEEFENRFSRFRPESDLNLLLREGKIPLQGDFVELIRLSLSYEKETAGFFNPTIDLGRMGYDRSFESMPRSRDGRETAEIKESANANGTLFHLDEALSFDTDEIRLRHGIALDF